MKNKIIGETTCTYPRHTYYSEIISEQESQTTSSMTSMHYIPHHPVRKESPIRIIYDYSCRQSQDQPSLNNWLMVGPTFLNEMCGILLRFRTHRYGLSNDIEKAFLHITLKTIHSILVVPPILRVTLLFTTSEQFCLGLLDHPSC